jgi:hypothetical protein
MVSRVGGKRVGIVVKDEEPFIVPGPRDWDWDEKLRQNEVEELVDLALMTPGTMELTRHIVTYFSSDLEVGVIPVVRDLRKSSSQSGGRNKRKNSSSSSNNINAATLKEEQTSDDDKVQVKIEDCSAGEDTAQPDLKIYQCETKIGKELLYQPLASAIPGGGSSSSNSNSTGEVVNNNKTPVLPPPPPSTGGGNNNQAQSSPAIALIPPPSPEKKNCVLSPSPINFSKANLNSNSSSSTSTTSTITPSSSLKKGRRLDDVLGRLRKVELPPPPSAEEENALSESPMESSSSLLVEEPAANVPPVLPLENGCSETNSVNNNLLAESSSNLSMEELSTTTNTSATVNNTPQSLLLENLGENSSSETPTPNPNPTLAACDNANSSSSSSSAQEERLVQMGECLVRDPGCTLKRRRMEDLEDECYTRDEASLYLVSESQDSLARRTLSICNIIRNLTFVPGNDAEFGKCVPFLSLMGKLILLHHEHPLKSRLKLEQQQQQQQQQEQNPMEITTPTPGEEEEDGLLVVASLGSPAAVSTVDIDSDSCTSLAAEGEWWWDYVHHLREHVLVMIANISGQMDLSQFSEEISRPILDGLLHWAVCPAAYGQDPFPTLNPGATLSPQRLAIEALCKLSVIQGNVDLLLATPPYSRIERLSGLLCRSLCRTEEQVMREFSLNLLYYLSAADTGVARTIAVQNPCISLLISFIEQVNHFSYKNSLILYCNC